jgi:hypothetical protein
VQVFLTIALIAAPAAWLLAVYSRLARLRTEVKMAWQRLEQDQVNEAVKAVYNKHVSAYNSALENFPANVIAPLAGLKPARHF